MKLLIITQKVDIDDPILGFFHKWIEKFSKYYESIVVICLNKGKYNLPNNVKVLSLGKENGVSKIKYLYNFYKYIVQERDNYDKVFVHMNPIYVVMGGIIWRILGKSIALWYTHKNVDFKLRIAEIISDKIFSASKESFRLKSNKLKIVGHGIDTNLFCPSKENSRDKYTILSVGRISQTKNQYIIIDALNNLLEQYPQVKLILVGDAITSEDFKYKEKIQNRIKELKIDKSVIWVGSVKSSSTMDYYQRYEVFINLSTTGSLDKVVLEAMSSGIKVITSNEAFKSVLPEVNITTNNVQEICDKISHLFSTEYNNDLREYIISNHNIDKLIKNLYSQI